MSDKTKGLYSKFTVLRNDGTDALGQKHHGCAYFVLDLDHDPYAWPAIKAYADSVRLDHPKLADDLDKWLLDGSWFQ